jgi:hypothetical protein
VRAKLGTPFQVTNLSLTVDSAGAVTPPSSLNVPPNVRLIVVSVRYRTVGGEPGIVSPYDWWVTDGSGNAYGAVVDGIGDPLPERQLTAGASTGGRIGFEVPRTAQGLTLQFAAEVGYGWADLALPRAA